MYDNSSYNSCGKQKCDYSKRYKKYCYYKKYYVKCCYIKPVYNCNNYCSKSCSCCCNNYGC